MNPTSSGWKQTGKDVEMFQVSDTVCDLFYVESDVQRILFGFGSDSYFRNTWSYSLKVLSPWMLENLAEELENKTRLDITDVRVRIFRLMLTSLWQSWRSGREKTRMMSTGGTWTFFKNTVNTGEADNERGRDGQRSALLVCLSEPDDTWSWRGEEGRKTIWLRDSPSRRKLIKLWFTVLRERKRKDNGAGEHEEETERMETETW